jgi:predicted HNH restriction endonuclease
MHEYTVIVENDISQWEDETGTRYHFPKRYARLLKPGTRLLHYKGRMRDQSFASKRLSPDPHYFAFSIAGTHIADPDSPKGDMFLTIEQFEPFPHAVPHRIDGETIENIPAARKDNFWRDGVRSSCLEVFNKAASVADLYFGEPQMSEPITPDDFTTELEEGQKKMVFGTRYERHPSLRKAAINMHGTTCFACEVSLANVYGEVAKEFVHIHHKRPLHLSGPTIVNPKTDLVPLCPNCHSVVHLGGKLRTVNAVRQLLGKAPISTGE